MAASFHWNERDGRLRPPLFALSSSIVPVVASFRSPPARGSVAQAAGAAYQLHQTVDHRNESKDVIRSGTVDQVQAHK